MEKTVGNHFEKFNRLENNLDVLRCNKVMHYAWLCESADEDRNIYLTNEQF